MNKIKTKTSYDQKSDIKIFPFKSKIDIWKVFLLKKEKGKWFEMIVSFPDLYPDAPPFFKFISFPHHLNISSDGIPCFDLKYSHSDNVFDIISEIKQLLNHPEKDFSASVESYYLFLTDKNSFTKLEDESMQIKGKDDITEFMKNSPVIDIAENFSKFRL